MNDFKKRFTRDSKPGGFSRDGSSRPGFGGDRGGSRPRDSRGFDAPKELFKTSCSKCRTMCEVPFRPNGTKPVYCKDCFVRDDGYAPKDSYGSKGAYGKKPYVNERSAPRPQAVAEDPRISTILKELQALNTKLETLSAQLQSSAYASILNASLDRDVKPAPLKKRVVKKAAKKK
jgi:CxxC-x17-CxxC domain-containing protein